MKRIRTRLVRLLQGEAKSTPPAVDQQLRADHPERVDEQTQRAVDKWARDSLNTETMDRIRASIIQHGGSS